MNDKYSTKAILERLLLKYSKSVVSKEGSARNIKVIMQIENDAYFKNVLTKSDFELISEIENNFDELEKLKFITVLDRNTNFKSLKLLLNLEKVNDAYKYLEAKKPCEIIAENLLKLEKISKVYSSPILNNYLALIKDRIKSFKSVKKYLIEDLETVAKGIYCIETQTTSILKRNFSKKVFKDSKYLEKNEGRFLSIFNEFSPIKFENTTELFDYYNINKNPDYVYIKNGIRFKVNNQIIDLDEVKDPIALSADIIENIEIVNINVTKVITVENFTTFNYFAEDAIIIYLAGYAAKAKVKLLNKIYEFNKELEFLHFGDIDYGGINIFIDLKNKCKAAFKPLYMSVKELEKYNSECLPLSANDKKSLTDIKDNEIFNEVIFYMLENDIKLEQESIEFLN